VNITTLHSDVITSVGERAVINLDMLACLLTEETRSVCMQILASHGFLKFQFSRPGMRSRPRFWSDDGK